MRMEELHKQQRDKYITQSRWRLQISIRSSYQNKMANLILFSLWRLLFFYVFGLAPIIGRIRLRSAIRVSHFGLQDGSPKRV